MGSLTKKKKQSEPTPKTPTPTDGYSDGKELSSGYNPLKAAPGDILIPGAKVALPKEETAGSDASSDSPKDALSAALEDSGSPLKSLGLDNNLLDPAIVENFSSDPENPNLTNEMIGEFLKLTAEKSETSEDFLSNPVLSSDELGQITQNAIEKADIAKELPEIRPDEMKILPPVDDEKLEPEEIKEKQKKEAEKYLASLAFIFATNSPFPVDEPENFLSQLDEEQNTLISAMTVGDQGKIDDYAQRTRDGVEQIKKVEVPYIFKDIHKSALQLAIYTLDLKDDVAVDPNDPMKSLAALSSLQSVAESTLKLQAEMQTILDEYGISFIEFGKK